LGDVENTDPALEEREDPAFPEFDVGEEREATTPPADQGEMEDTGE
jgi:hypothetical protein